MALARPEPRPGRRRGSVSGASMRLATLISILSVLLAFSSSAAAGPVVDRVKSRGLVVCGSVERPGLAEPGVDGRWHGLNVDICRAVAAAVLGSPERVVYHRYATPKHFDAVARNEDDLYFLTASEISEHDLAGKVLPGPTVFLETDAAMVKADSKVRHVADLAGDSICFMIASSAERSLEAYFDALHKDWDHRPFSEDGEMNDTYNVQHCHAVAGEITTLADTRLDRGVNKMASRILPEPLTVFPIMAATGTGDGQWSALVAWTIDTLISAERPDSRWYAGGVHAMPIAAPELGLDPGWQQRVVAAVGHYGDIVERNLGGRSPFKLERGLNANLINNGIMLAPFIE
jgi:general L-amino acid transport system substrate-binding protein